MRFGAQDWKWSALPLLLALLLGSAASARAEEVLKTFTVTGHTRVRVQTDDGSVRVSTGDIKQVEVRVVYSGYKLDRDLRVSTSQSGDQVEVIAKTSGGTAARLSAKALASSNSLSGSTTASTNPFSIASSGDNVTP